MLLELDKYCHQHNLTYFMCGGSLLETVRHKGFIPWDDDIDIGLEDSVKFLGLCKDVQALYNAMDVFVLPSWYEGLSIVSVEAQANGLRSFFLPM